MHSPAILGDHDKDVFSVTIREYIHEFVTTMLIGQRNDRPR